LLEVGMSNDIFETLADTYYLATTLRLRQRKAAEHPEAPVDETPATAPQAAAHPLLAGLLDLEVVRRFRARPQGCG
jgi:hypothetical protein